MFDNPSNSIYPYLYTCFDRSKVYDLDRSIVAYPYFIVIIQPYIHMSLTYQSFQTRLRWQEDVKGEKQIHFMSSSMIGIMLEK